MKTVTNALYLLLILGLTGCAGSAQQNAELAEFQRERAQESRTQELNEQLALQNPGAGPDAKPQSKSYRLGAGDLLDVSVLGASDLDRKVRVDGDGKIGLPLIGEVSVGGLTVDEASRLVAEHYEESYLRDPQISLLIEEYRSQRITVLGAVKNPEVYTVQRQLTLTEALAKAGGINEEAGDTVYVTDRVKEPETNKVKRRSLIISLQDLISEKSEHSNMVLGDEAVVNVPPAGVVYVEGAVEKPGAYDIKGDTTVLKAIAMANGLAFEADKSELKLLRMQEDGTFEPKQFDIDSLRQDPANDVSLEDGDIVVVETHALKSVVWRLIDTTRGFFGFGIGL